VITSAQPRFSPQEQQDLSTSEAQKSEVPTAIKDQMKASEIMAEKLPGLIDPNLPTDQQPLHDNSNPNPATPPPQPLHPDEFSPGAAPTPAPETDTESTPKAQSRKPASPPAEGRDGAPQPPEKSQPQTTPRNP
jgi:rod shape-determining protein MreC